MLPKASKRSKLFSNISFMMHADHQGVDGTTNDTADMRKY